MPAFPRSRSRIACHRSALARAAAAVALGLAALLAHAEAQPPATEPVVPGLRLPRDVVPVRYAPRLTIDPALPTFTGTIDIDVRVERPTDVVWLNAKEITLRGAKAVVGGAQPEEIRATRIGGSDDVMGLKFERPLPAGDARIALGYTAKIQELGAIGVFRQQEAGRWYVLTQFEPMDARRAFPCFDEPDMKAEWSLSLVVPRGVRAFANMPVERETEAAAGMKEVAFASTPRLPSYLIAFAVGEFDVRDAGRAGRNATPIAIVTPKGRSGEAAYAAARTGAILAAAEHFFGQPYPFPKLDLVAYPRSSGAMENPGLVTYAARLLLAREDEISPSFEQRFMGVTAHEIAHMWFGDYVTMAWWNDLWLNESFASWLGTKIVQELRPDWPRGAWRLRQRTYAIDNDRLASARRIRQPITDAGEVRAAFDPITYAKGETILAMFEQWLGPDRFREGVRRYMARYAWGNATADDFFAALAATDDAIVPSFRDFVERAGVPLLTVSLDCSGAPRLLLAQSRFAAVGAPPAAAAERWVFPACFEHGDAARGRQTCTLVRDARQSVPLDAAACPRWVIANRSGSGYYLPRLSPALYAALPTAAKVLADADYEPLLADADLLARSGLMGYEEALPLAAQHADSRSLLTALRAHEIPGNLPPELVAPANAAKYAAWLRKHYGPRAHHLGWLPRKSDTPLTPRLRQSALPLVAVDGADAALAREARRLARRWLADREAVPPQMRRVVLEAAARTAGKDGPALFDGLVAVAKTTKDQNEREDVLNALGQFRDPALGARALALAFDPAIEARDGTQVVRAALQYAPTRPDALAWLDANFDRFGSRLPREHWSAVAYWADGTCTPAERERFVALLGPRLAAAEVGARAYRQSLERIDLCLALRDARAEPLNAFLAAQK
ncbi:MAG: ERAP1-like C-terminal domain-containing protein [Betaproteobacteria bacterium]|nr:ERAP1-like C-terminal domain-containing protein [Betaproteobacteria bacterium]MCC7217535.1 ERAP1-like C-terminal domain-containing protein [Burkholderiales bacterium]